MSTVQFRHAKQVLVNKESNAFSRILRLAFDGDFYSVIIFGC